jgi:UDP-2-acetamido-2,6-beta-L-arabino-hexul-4-ose reductase
MSTHTPPPHGAHAPGQAHSPAHATPQLRTIVEPVRTHRDARGALFEPLDEAGLAPQRNVHVVLTEPGAIRGNHRHGTGTEVTVVMGPAFVRLKEQDCVRDVEVPPGETWRFTIPPGVVHAYRNPGPGTMVLVAFNTEVHDPANPDTFREEIL